jgi:hypothetical protein
MASNFSKMTPAEETLTIPQKTETCKFTSNALLNTSLWRRTRNQQPLKREDALLDQRIPKRRDATVLEIQEIKWHPDAASK